MRQSSQVSSSFYLESRYDPYYIVFLVDFTSILKSSILSQYALRKDLSGPFITEYLDLSLSYFSELADTAAELSDQRKLHAVLQAASS